MKKIFLLIVSFSFALCGWSQLLTENFSYTAGTLLTTNSTWAAHSGAGTNSIMVTSPGLTYSGHPGSGIGNAVSMTTSGEDDNLQWAVPVTTGSTYMSFLVNVSAAQATGDYFIGLFQSGTVFPLRIYAKLSGAGYVFGVSKSGGTPVYDATVRTFGTTYFVVGNYIFNTGTTTDDVANLWVNPAFGGTEPAATIPGVTGTTADGASNVGVYLRQGTAGSAATQQVDAILAGTTWASVTPSGAPTPTLSATTLTAFGNVCTNTTTAPNSFTITGTNLTAGNVSVAALSGFTYSTTVGGTYTSTLTIAETGTLSQQVFVEFTPTAVQSYSGNIGISGGGAPAINVAASGAGVNTIPSLTSGAASGITTTAATVAGTITATGCTAVTAYGIEYSTTAGFANGSGTPVTSTNLAGGNFTSALSGLAPGTVYYYHSYATNGGGTGYGAQGTFTTSSAVPTLSATTLTAFGNVCINTTTAANSFTITGSNLTAGNVTVAALSGYTYSTTVGGTYTATLTIAETGTLSQQVFVKFTPTAVQSYSGNIGISGGGAPAINVAASGAGVNSVPTLTAGAASAITTSSATVAGTINTTGCTAVTAYGIEYSTTAGFANGSGTAVSSSNLAAGNFTSALSGLASGTTYYYHAYATNGGGTGYSSESSFVTLATTPTLSGTAIAAFGNVCVNTTAGPNSFTINGSALTAANITVGPLANYTFSTTSGGTYTASLSIAQPGGTFVQQVFVKFTPTAVQSYNGNIPVGGGGAATVNVAASGAGINSIGAVTTGAASAITSISATLAGTISSTGCSAITAYGVEYSTINGFANGTGTAVTSTNLAGGNFTSNVTGLAASTVYYYHAYATNGGGTAYGTQQTFTTATPGIAGGTLTAFGAVCVNTTAGPNSFTITGTNLTAANVTVGPLAGFTFSTTSGGTYTATLSLTQPSGSYSQAIFVKFTPTAVQSYNGNIPVGGGGATTANVAASGSGVNSAPTVTAGAASGITGTSATVAGTIPTTGCSAVTAYGIEYSTTAGFANGTGTAVASTNLSGINFTSSLTGLIPATVYYYHAYATNGGGTAYSTQQSFTSGPAIITAGTLTAFGSICINTTAGPNSFTITSTAVNASNINIAALAGYTYSATATGAYTSTLSFTHPAGAYSQTVFVKFTPTTVQSYNGNIAISGGGLSGPVNVAASGTGVNTAVTVVTGAATNITSHSATLGGTVTASNCNTSNAAGIEYSSIGGFVSGTGTKVPASVSSGTYTVDISGLVQNSFYYYKAYSISTSGTVYGAIDTFKTAGVPAGLVIYSNPIFRGGQLNFTVDNAPPAHYVASIINSMGQVVFTQTIISQLNFLDTHITVPSFLPVGVYTLQLRNTNGTLTAGKRFMLL